jgi:uncharacterized protein
MRMEGRRRSDNVVDERHKSGTRPGAGLAVGGGGGLLTLVIIILAVVFNVDPRPLLQNMPQQVGVQEQAAPFDPDQDAQAETKVFVEQVLAMTEDVWSQLLPRDLGKTYQKPKLRLFRGQIDSACGYATSAAGPFYCPGDNMIYLDMEFFDELKNRFRAPGDFAMAYVIAHEVAHHIQNQLGLSMQVQRQEQQLKRQGKEPEANRLSVRLELQADFLAGVWAHHAERSMRFLEAGDLDEALRAARQIGDDTLQKQARGYVVPDSFTHGSSEQRVRWFRRGFQTGNLEEMDRLFDLPYDKL